MLRLLILVINGIAYSLKTLGWFFLLPFSFFYSLVKDWVISFAVALYRLWRVVKKILRKISPTSLAGPEQKLLSLPTPLLIITMAVLGFNLHSRVAQSNFDSQSLVDQIFNQMEEFSVIDSVLAQSESGSSIEMLAAIETVMPPSYLTAPLLTTNTDQFLSGQGGALIRPGATNAAPATRGQVIEYVVQPGDTISDIADAHGISTATVLWANNLSDHSLIHPGEKLKILPTSGIMHIVQEGETLSGIAKKYSVEVAVITEANELVSEHQLQIKQGLIIPGGKLPATKPQNTQLANLGRIFSPSKTTPSESGFTWPTPWDDINQYWWVKHKAIDIDGESSHTIVASRAGRVEYAGWSNGYGYNVLLNNGNNVKTRYAHLRQLWVEAGQQVEQGEGLGKMGTTGRSTGVHLHFEIIINGSFVNPLSYL